MTPTEKKYSKLVGEICQYNYRYWIDWNDEENKKHIVMLSVEGVRKDEYNGRYFYTLRPLGECEYHWMVPSFQIPCSEFVSQSRSRVYDVGACAPAAPVCAIAVPTQEV